ncbi:hypothetical protein BDN71DRAFT_1513164 [Pleurotus eryngii]|uniref:Uncharacterized protein n=1 Tax=Pleurotus eryngii TaxID=5323 RepID=A0A9P5ZKK2_PLEER|nr:hypothetical protein BDN71DRAFT_1513158 [Pleurotus eryngii]KAF9488325.1 hypothetical protein BDN71DRAFT_1513164 [Pleurotus eryngii]
MCSFVKNLIWVRRCLGDSVFHIRYEDVLLTHVVFAAERLSESSSVTIHYVGHSREELIWDAGTLLTGEREHMEAYFPFHGNKEYSVHTQGPSEIYLAGVSLNVRTSEVTSEVAGHCARCRGDPPPVPSSSTVTKEVSATVPQEATAAKKRAGKKRAIVGVARVTSPRRLKAGKAGPGLTA